MLEMSLSSGKLAPLLSILCLFIKEISQDTSHPRTVHISVCMARLALISKWWHNTIKMQHVERAPCRIKGVEAAACSVPESPPTARRSEHFTPTAGAIRVKLTHPASRQDSKNNTSCNLKTPSGRQFTFKLNLWCHDLWLNHTWFMRGNSSPRHRYKLDNQALIWDLIKGGQCEEAPLTKKMKNTLTLRMLQPVFSH